VRFAVDAIRRRPGRSAATTVGIGLATALVVILLALSAGIQTSATRLATASGIDLLATSANTSIASGTFPPLGEAHSISSSLKGADGNVVAASPWLVTSLAYANASLYGAANASRNGTPVPPGWAPVAAGTVGWIPSANAGLKVPEPLVGPGFSSSGDPHYANGSYAGPVTRETEVDQGLASLLHVAPGDLLWVSDRSASGPSDLPHWFANASAFRIAAVTQPFWLIPSALLGFFYLSELQALTGSAGPGKDYASLVLVHLSDPTNPSSDQALLGREFPSLSFFTIGNVLTVVQQSVDLYRTFGTIVGVIALVVATLFTTTILLMSVEDRSRELALLRAVGFSRSRVGLFVVEEGFLLAGIGLVLGLALGWVGATTLNQFLDGLVNGLPAGFTFLSFDATVVIGGAVEVALIGVFASLGPAARAMTLPIAAELRAP